MPGWGYQCVQVSVSIQRLEQSQGAAIAAKVWSKFPPQLWSLPSLLQSQRNKHDKSHNI